jgi:hypothetical protein
MNRVGRMHLRGEQVLQGYAKDIDLMR